MSIQQQKHYYYIQEGKDVYQNIDPKTRLSDAEQDISSKKVRQIQLIVKKHEADPKKHRKFMNMLSFTCTKNGLLEIVEEQEELYQQKMSELGDKAVLMQNQTMTQFLAAIELKGKANTAFEAALRENSCDGRAHYLAVMGCHHMATQIMTQQQADLELEQLEWHNA